MAFSFARNILSFFSSWEYPGRQGLGCNVVNTADDTANFQSFLTLLKKQAPAGLTLSAAVRIAPFDVNGTPTTDVSAAAAALDYIEIMNYDIWGNWNTESGPNAPLDDSCAPADEQGGSAASAVKAWTAAGFPAHKIVLGVAGYGHSGFVDPSAAFDGSSLAAYPTFANSTIPPGDDWDVLSPAGSVDVCGNSTAGYTGVWNFAGMIEKGVLNADGTPASGFSHRFDSCSQTVSYSVQWARASVS